MHRAERPADDRGHAAAARSSTAVLLEQIAHRARKAGDRIAHVALGQLAQIGAVLLERALVESEAARVLRDQLRVAAIAAHLRQLERDRAERIAGHQPRREEDDRHRDGDRRHADDQSLAET